MNHDESSGSSGRAIRFRYLFLFATVFSGTFIILTINNVTSILKNEAINPNWELRRYEIESKESFTIQTEGCVIPGLKPLDKTIEKFVNYPKDMKPCPSSNVSLVDNNNTHIWIKKENLNYYNVTKDSHFSCCYKAFYRPVTVSDITSSRIDDRVKYQDCIYFNETIEVHDEFVRVICKDNEINIYEQFFLFSPKKKFLSHDRRPEIPKHHTAYNVIIMGIDAVSRLNFYRTMPKTLAFMKKKNAIELLGYNKVGDNTFPNLIPMLLGIDVTELKKTCLPTDKSTFDNCPFIWEWFKQAGYYTALGEDSSRLGTFNYAKVGFSGTPTDYYIHTFINEAERNAGKIKDFNSYLCMNEKLFFKLLLEYIESLTSTLKSSKLFGFFWEVTMSHDHLNYPMVMDDSYATFFSKLDNSGYLNETIFLLLSDHGIRWGDIRSTKQGRLEERLPFLFLLLPPSFQKNYSAAFNNLKSNSHRLTTPYDVHATLTDLINLNNIVNETILTRSNVPYFQDKSISLFLPIPQNRTCTMAGINDHWCTCHRGIKLSKKTTEAKEAAIHLIQHLNKLLTEHPQCAQLTLVEILEATEMLVGTTVNNKNEWREFLVVARTSPSDGIFEATLRYDNSDWSLSGTISRLNLYGDQSHCVDNYQLKLYCYCQ